MEAAIGYLKAQPRVRTDRIGVTGFCMGGRISFLVACRSQSIAAAVPFYGGGIASGERSERTPIPPIELASQLRCPVAAPRIYGLLSLRVPAVALIKDRGAL